jgi:hypothetical protein
VLLIWRAIPKLVLLGFVVLAAVLLWWAFQALPVTIPRNYNEGWNGFHALRFRTGGDLYPPVSPGQFINYPPLSFWVVGSLASVLGDDIVAGRIISAIGLGISALNVALAARRLGVSAELAAIAALAFLCFVAMFFSDYTVVDDPQWLAQALQSTGLGVLLGNRRDWQWLAVVALLLVAGGLAKQLLVALPLSVTVWLAFEDRRALLRWIACCAAIGLVALALCFMLYGPNFFAQVFGSGRTYSFETIRRVAVGWGVHFAPFVLAGALGCWLGRGNALVRFTGVYLAISLVAGTLLMSAVGVVYNALFDLILAMMIASAVLVREMIARLGTTERNATATMALAAVLFSLRFATLAPDALTGWQSTIDALAHRQQWSAVIDRIHDATGPVACETLSLCYWAGRPSEIDFFNFGQRTQLYPGFEAPVADAIAAGRIGLIQMEENAPPRLPADIEALIKSRYMPLGSDPAILLVPK